MSTARHFATLLVMCLLPLVASAQDSSSSAKVDRAEKAAPSKDTVSAKAVSVVQGVVMDSMEKPMRGAEVIVTDTRNRVITRVRTAERGAFAFRTLKPGSYRIGARAVGYLNGRSEVFNLKGGDTLDLQFVLDANDNALAAVRVVSSSNPQYRITADEIAKKPDRDALDVVLNRRIRMLGDTYKGCMADTSEFTLDFRFIRKSPKSMSMDSSMPLRLYINGIRYGVRGIKDVLSEIPAEDIAELNYVDCWDTTRPNLRNSLIVILKPGKRY